LLLSAAYAPQAPYTYASTAPSKPEAAPETTAEPDTKPEPVSVAPEAPAAPPPEAAPAAPPPATPPPTTTAALAPGEEDTDEDGIPDNEDACKRVKGVASEIPHLNGCPPPPPPVDTDGDGVADENDACPKKKGVASDDPKLNGCPPPKDTDGDGIADREDACPRKPGVASDDPKHNGCPEVVAKAIAAPAAPKAAPAPAPAPVTKARVSTAAGGAAELTFAGFRSFDDGTSLVFVELSGPVTVDEKQTPGTIVYTLANTKVPVRNNRNPLTALEFSSVVRRATIVQKKKAVEITISLKADVQPSHQIVQRGGATVLEIRLPKAPTSM
jgi:hypothetical protein